MYLCWLSISTFSSFYFALSLVSQWIRLLVHSIVFVLLAKPSCASVWDVLPASNIKITLHKASFHVFACVSLCVFVCSGKWTSQKVALVILQRLIMLLSVLSSAHESESASLQITLHSDTLSWWEGLQCFLSCHSRPVRVSSSLSQSPWFWAITESTVSSLSNHRITRDTWGVVLCLQVTEFTRAEVPSHFVSEVRNLEKG